MSLPAQTKNANYLSYILSAVILLLPFSTPLIVWGSQYMSVYILSAWKEALLLLATPFAIAVFIQVKWLRNVIVQHNLTKLLFVLLGVYVVWTALTWNGAESAAGFATGTRYLFAYLLALITGLVNPKVWPLLLRAICYAATIVAIFGLLQTVLLPKDLLTNLGYDEPGINTLGVPPAYHLIAGNESYVRAQSTLRGPNVLGAYLILPLIIVALMILRKSSKSLFLIGITCSTALFFSFSRSAWIGASVGIFMLILTQIHRDKMKQYLRWQYIAGVLVAISITAGLLSKTSTVQTLIFHNAPGEISASNEGHKDALLEGMKDVISDPVGSGPGSAGPASVLEGSSRISENYFIQIGQEIGWLGLAIFLWVCIELIRFFYSHREHDAALILLYSFIGLSITAMFLHTWSDEAVALTWWIMAGIGTGVILNEKRKHYVPYRQNTVKEKPSKRSQTHH